MNTRRVIPWHQQSQAFKLQNTVGNTQATRLWNKTRLECLDDAQGLDEAGTKQKHSVKKEAKHVTGKSLILVSSENGLIFGPTGIKKCRTHSLSLSSKNLLSKLISSFRRHSDRGCCSNSVSVRIIYILGSIDVGSLFLEPVRDKLEAIFKDAIRQGSRFHQWVSVQGSTTFLY